MLMKLKAVRIVSLALAVSFIGRLFPLEGAFAFQAPQLPLVAVMPFEIHGLSSEESDLLRSEFLKSLRSTDRFAIMSDDSMWTILKEANMSNIEQCTYSPCIADVGKILGVERVFHVAVSRRGKLYTARVRVVGSENADILLDATKQHSGEFEPLLTTVLPDLARDTQEARPASWRKYKWYIVGGAVLVLGTAMYLIGRSITRSSGSDAPNQPNPGPAN